MLRGPVGRRALGSFPVAGALLGFSPVGAHASSYDEAIARALRLLPRQPEKIVLVERPNTTHLHEGKPNVEAFITQGGRVVYLVRQGVTLQGALKGPGVFDYGLAAIIWHEMAHIDGADESAARLVEEPSATSGVIAVGTLRPYHIWCNWLRWPSASYTELVTQVVAGQVLEHVHRLALLVPVAEVDRADCFCELDRSGV